MKKRSKLGYKRYSPDVNNPYNVIPSGRITMKDVDFPVYGVDEYGNSQMMYPGAEYQFPGNQVFEIPMAQYGSGIDPEMMFRNKYNTELTPEEQKAFNGWVAKESARRRRDIMMDMGAYDLQGFWKSGDYKNMDQDNHGSDKWKKPNHPTFSNQSIYHNADGQAGGVWKDNGGYQPSPHTLGLYDIEYYDWLFGSEPHRTEHLDLSRSTIVPKPSISPSTFNFKKGGLVKAQFGINTAAFMPMMAQAYGAASSWFNDDSKPAATPAPAVPETVDWRKLSRPKQIDYAIGELTAFEKEENKKALENLLESTAYMENRYGEDPRAYGRNYTSSFMSIDPIALQDMFTGRGANGAYNSAQRRQFETFKQLNLPTDQKQFDALLREDNPVAAMAAARYRYALVPQALPAANDQQGMFDYWLKYYNGSGILKHKTRAQAYRDFQRAYQRALSND